MLPVIGLGTWQTFDVVPGKAEESLSEVLRVFYERGCRLIDSSPMYGKAEETVGRLTEQLEKGDEFFYASKVWTTGRAEGVQQMEASFAKFRRPVIDLMQVHNLVDWKVHLDTLRKWKEEGRVRYIGITHYTDASHEQLEAILSTVPIDFVQFNYSVFARHAVRRLLPAAAAHGVATLINRPLGEGSAFSMVRGRPLPAWVKEWGIDSWASFFLKFIIAHPAVTCVIPATSNAGHMAEDARAGRDLIPDEQTRQRMIAVLEAL
jgi:diketogulonate reductase-like aldo/keto reductase